MCEAHTRMNTQRNEWKLSYTQQSSDDIFQHDLFEKENAQGFVKTVMKAISRFEKVRVSHPSPLVSSCCSCPPHHLLFVSFPHSLTSSSTPCTSTRFFPLSSSLPSLSPISLCRPLADPPPHLRVVPPVQGAEHCVRQHVLAVRTGSRCRLSFFLSLPSPFLFFLAVDFFLLFLNCCAQLRARNRALGSYYYVTYSGSVFGDLDGQTFMYKMPKITKLGEVMDKMRVSSLCPFLCVVIFSLFGCSSSPPLPPHPTQGLYKPARLCFVSQREDAKVDPEAEV